MIKKWYPVFKKNPVSVTLKVRLSVFTSPSQASCLSLSLSLSPVTSGGEGSPAVSQPLLSCPPGRVLRCRRGGGRKLCLLTVTLNFLRWGINIEILKWKMRRAQRGWGGREGGSWRVGRRERREGREDRRIGGGEETGGPLREETRPSPLCQAAF